MPSTISSPPQVARTERSVIALITIAAIAFPLVPVVGYWACAGVVVLLTIASFVRQWRAASQLGFFFSVWFAMMLTGWVSQITIGGSLLVILAVTKWTPWLAGGTDWLHRGTIDRTTVLLATGFTVCAGIALVTWHQLVQPDLRDLLYAFLPDWPLWQLALGAIAFSMINAAVEEGAYRGVLQHSLDAAFEVPIAVLLQAVAFGTLHINGFPRGAIGVVLATIYGLMMGIVRVRSKGILAPWVAHVVTDMTIVAILVFLAR